MPDHRPRYVPVSTYRLQLHHEFPFAAAERIVAYLARLGAGACYTSPYFTATPGSTHGYDVVNHNEINPELGGEDGHRAFTACLTAHGLGHVVDFVPNHMGIDTGRNAWWRDVLENGPSSPASRFFDVDWDPIKPELHAKLMLPILGDQYGSALERGELQLAFRDGSLLLTYFDYELPVNPRQAPRVYRRAVEPLAAALGRDNSRLLEFQSILASLQNLPPYTEQAAERVAERQREKEVARARLAKLVAECPTVREHIEQAVREVNGEPGRSGSFDAMHELLEAQAYRVSYWRAASHEINYRRFFDINTLAGLRVEDPAVFEATHQLLARLLRDGAVSAVRIDHPDGLFDPARYFEMLQDLACRAWDVERETPRPLWVAAEKILSAGEQLPPRWAVHGTTGYNYLNDLNGLFVDAKQVKRVRRAYAKLTGSIEPFEEVLYASKRLIMETAMASELTVLAHRLDRIAESNRRSRDFTLESLRNVITEVVACFPVYRTYVDERGWTAEDRAVVVRAVARARRRNPAMEASLFDFLLEVVLPRGDESGTAHAPDRRGGYPAQDAAESAARRRFAMKLQQYTGPLQAKGLEDTAFYRYNLLLSLNEVGGDPERFGRSPAEFHAANEHRLRHWPFEMLATSTHDTKLGEDVRARVNTLSEIPEDWAREVSRWMRINRTHRTVVDGDPAPDRNDEYRFYQALVGAWPLEAGDSSVDDVDRGKGDRERAAGLEFVARIQAYMIKAVKEAKRHTSWLTPNAPYENAVLRFVERVLTGPGQGRFLPAFLPFQQRVAQIGLVNSLAQLTLKLGSPGIPDFYQGTELWDLSLVDPDNRRPVDFAHRAALLDEIESVLAEPLGQRRSAVVALQQRWRDGRIKLLLTVAGLRLRRDWPEGFLQGAYLPLETEVSVPADLVAFARVFEDRAAVFVVPRLAARLVAQAGLPLGGDAWKTSRVLLPPELSNRTFRHVVTGAEIRPTSTNSRSWIFAGEIFQVVPFGILVA
ncbi:MAG TPA: malto-oligosyltrehalose synthase [Vicinamibacterales bacterium]|nr:malto-oligosyltrehalose synthase [Vicinamibacterales bacterium]